MPAQASAVAADRPRTLESSTFCEAFQATSEERAQDPALRLHGGPWITWAQYGERVRSVAGGLAALGVGRGDTVGLMLVNRPEFHICDCATMHLGATAFSLYTTAMPDSIEYVLSNAETKVLITERQFIERILVVRDALPALAAIVVVDEPAEGAITLEELESGAKPDFDFEATWRAVEPDDVLTLIYTSGTTGKPKGVQLTHQNLLAEARAVDQVMPIARGRLISFLPAAHIADRLQSQYCAMVYGHQLTCVPDPRAVVEAVAEVRPTFMLTIPPLWEALKAILEAQFAAEPDEAKRTALLRAVEVGLQKVRAEQAREPVPEDVGAEWAQADRTVLREVREQIGFGELEFAVVGAAAIPGEVIEFVAALGIVPLEVFGMSEASAIVTVNPPAAPKFGTVGRALPGVEVGTAADGELIIRGPTVMKGYRNMPEKTAESIDQDGWLLTGDIAHIDDEGYVKILYRKKDLILTAAGDQVVPANIEGALRSAGPLIAQAIAIGTARPYNVALIVLDPDAVPVFAKAAGITDTSLEAVVEHQAVLDEVERCVSSVNERLSEIERIRKYKVLAVSWLPGGEELTPTMKLKREPIGVKYAVEIEALYA